MGLVRWIGEVNIGDQHGDELLLVLVVRQAAADQGCNGRSSGRHPEGMHKLVKQSFVRKDSAGLVFVILQVFRTGSSLRISFWPEVHHGPNHSTRFRSGLRGRGAVTIAFCIRANLQNTVQKISRVMPYVIRNAFQQDSAQVGAFYLDQGIQRSRLVVVSGPV
jgi:hypothetical protein